MIGARRDIRGEPRPQTAPAAPPPGITLRATLIGAVCVALLACVNLYVTFITRVWSVGSGSLLSGAIVMLTLLVALNGLLRRWRPRWSLARGELLVVYGMMTVSVGLAMQGGIPYILTATTYPFYMASPNNE